MLLRDMCDYGRELVCRDVAHRPRAGAVLRAIPALHAIVGDRPSPENEVAKIWVPMMSCGIAFSRRRRSTPRSLKTSAVLRLVMWARGESAVPPYLVMPMAFTPARAKKADAVSPAGPAPTTAA